MTRNARIAIFVLSAAMMLLVQACASSSAPAPTAVPATATKPAAAAPTTAVVASPTVAAAATKAATTTGAATAPAATGAGDPAKGKAVFDSNCTMCHPNGQKGVGPALIGESSADVLKVVRSGKGSMPAYTASQISDQQLNDLAAYVTSLK